jgi:hypothetical protein
MNLNLDQTVQYPAVACGDQAIPLMNHDCLFLLFTQNLGILHGELDRWLCSSGTDNLRDKIPSYCGLDWDRGGK